MMQPLVSSSSSDADGNNNNSPSFVKQEILDAPDDWQLWGTPSNMVPIKTHEGQVIGVETVKDISECKLGNGKFVSPDIESVSYVSDGKVLNATVWLTDPFEQQSPSNNINYPYQEQLQVKVSNLTSPNLTVEKQASKVMGEILDPLNNSTIDEESNSSSIAGTHAFKLVYSATNSEGLELKNMTYWTIKNNKLYDITFSALQANYNHYLPIIERMIKSIEFARTFDEYTTKDNKSGTEQYNNSSIHTIINPLGIKIDYPADWKKKEVVDKENRMVIFYSPESPSWHNIKFTMALAIDSVQHHGVTDYRVIYSKNPDNDNTSNSNLWTRQVLEVSAFDRGRILEEEKNYTAFYKEGQPYIVFSFDLSKINFPQEYRAVFYITDYFILHNRFCTSIDTTSWAIMPPPEFSMSTQPPTSSIVLRPGEDKDIELTIKGNTHLPSEALLSNSSNNNANYVELRFTPDRISIPPSSIGTSTLHIRALDKAKPVSYNFPIVANISYPNTITNRGGESFSNSKTVSLLQSWNLTLTVVPAYTLQENLNNFVNSWINPISGMWTFLAGVAAVVGPLIIRRRQKKQRD